MAKLAGGSPFLTTGERVRNFLGWAFVISLAGHLVLGPLIPFKQTHAEEQQVEKVSLMKKTKVKVPTPPPPTPTPKPTEPPKSTPQPKQPQKQQQLKVNLVKTHTTTGAGPSEPAYTAPKSGSENGAPNAQGTPAGGGGHQVAAPTPTPKPACADPFRDATMTNGVSPEYPESAKEQGLGPVTVIVKITLSPGASVESATVLQSSGNMAIDQAAMLAARQSSYAPKLVNCAPAEGTYSFRANFDPAQ
ncbi:MAG: energy transducer TonB [Candidatus Eremiobacteraeota bacterium]|nr:energy transducer TonB [Candidatus Eremiobacteraeota bacterium]MBV9737158.1 energy transducer TonB [Candidatus Eremiobacteraeota bacterium]